MATAAAGNRSGELLPCYVGRSLLYVAPIDYCVGVEVAVDRQGETWSACIHAIRHHSRKDRNNPSLRGRLTGGVVAAARVRYGTVQLERNGALFGVHRVVRFKERLT